METLRRELGGEKFFTPPQLPATHQNMSYLCSREKTIRVVRRYLK